MAQRMREKKDRKPSVYRWTAEEFWNNVTPIPDTGCWVWAGSSQANPYGTAAVEGAPGSLPAHRASFFLTHGRLPRAGRMVIHLCDVRGCINPDHLADATIQRNAEMKGRRDRIMNASHPAIRRMWGECDVWEWADNREARESAGNALQSMAPRNPPRVERRFR